MSKISRKFTLDNARSVAATGTTPSIDVSQDDGYCVQSVFSALATGASGTLVLQTSLDGTNFADYPNSSQNFASGTTTLVWEMNEKRHQHARLKLSATSAGTGTVTTTYYGEAFQE